MDANTKKTVSMAFVALLLGSVFVAGSAVAQTSNPTSNPDVAVDAVTNNTSVSGAVYNATLDLTFTNIPATSGDVGSTYTLYPPGSTTAKDARSAYRDLAHVGSSRVNVTFPAVQLGAVGLWRLAGTGGDVAWLNVAPEANLQVSLSSNSIPFTDGFTSFTVNVVDLSTGGAAKDVDLKFEDINGNSLNVPGSPKTDANGVYYFSGFIVAAGDYRAVATRNVAGTTSEPEFQGNATFTVVPATLTRTELTPTILHGFDKETTNQFSYPLNTTKFFGVGQQYVHFNVTLPNGSAVWMNASDFSAANSSLSLWNGSANYDYDASCTGEALYKAADHSVSFKPCGNWEAGTYSFSIKASTSGNALPEYQASWTLATQAPSAINVAVKDGGAVVKNLTVKQTTGLPASPIAGNYDLTVEVEGDKLGQFPGQLPVDNVAFPTSNITVTGDVLPGWTVTSPSAGTFTVSDVVPTKYGGNVSINVAWKNTTTSVVLPIVAGAVLSSETAEVLVDKTTNLVVTLKDQYGNTIPDGAIYAFDGISNGTYPGVGQFSIIGNGAPGAGQNGQYTLTVKPTKVGTMTVYGVIGDSPHFNYTYMNVRVVPAHDVNVTLSKNTTMAALLTHVFVNATIDVNGTAAASTAIYFLNETEKASFEKNNALPSGAANAVFDGTPAGANGVVNTGAASAAGFHMNVSLPAGTYSVYVCSDFTGSSCTSAKHDNVGNLPTFTVTPYKGVFSPESIADNADIQKDTKVNVTVTDAAGNPAYGTLTIKSGAPALTAAFPANVSVSNGTGTFTVTGKALGDLAFNFDPWGDNYNGNATLDGKFSVVGPAVTVTPGRIPVGQTTPLTITVKSLNGSALADKVVRVCGSPIGGFATAPDTISANTTGCTGEVSTDSNGISRLGVLPTSTGTLYLYVNNTKTSTTVPVVAGLVITYNPAQPTGGDSVTITVTQPGRTGESGVSVNVTKGNETVLTQVTGSAGQVVLPNVAEGTYMVTATKAGFETAYENITVGAKANETPDQKAKFELENLNIPSTGTVGSGMTASATVKNTGNGDGTANAILLVNGAQRGSQSVFVAAGGSQDVAFDFTPNQAGSYKVTIKLASGETLAEKTVTIETPTTTPTQPTTPTGGQSPSPTTPTGGTATPTEPTGVPGFEFVALIGALGAALLVLRRRN